MTTLLFIGKHFPEPKTTAAGARTMQLLELFQASGHQICFASSSKSTKYSKELEDDGIKTRGIKLNDPSFDGLLQELQPQVVVFDRYTTEEQFGWRVKECCPEAMCILDTQDLHFLREARAEALAAGIPVSKAELMSDTTRRELASIYRCDLSLIISEAEMELLKGQLRVPEDLLCYVPFMIDPIDKDVQMKLPGFESRKDFITFGSFLHAPNTDMYRYLKTHIWPGIKSRLPQTNLYIYGAYSESYKKELESPSEGLYVKGWVPDIHEQLKESRVCLAPLRFGAGLKGKIFDAMLCGTPTVTTKVGEEGISGKADFPGFICDDPQALVRKAFDLYSEPEKWKQARNQGFKLLNNRFQKEVHQKRVSEIIENVRKTLFDRRNQNITGQILAHQTLQGARYLSKWIAEKNAKRT